MGDSNSFNSFDPMAQASSDSALPGQLAQPSEGQPDPVLQPAQPYAVQPVQPGFPTVGAAGLPPARKSRRGLLIALPIAVAVIVGLILTSVLALNRPVGTQDFATAAKQGATTLSSLTAAQSSFSTALSDLNANSLTGQSSRDSGKFQQAVTSIEKKYVAYRQDDAALAGMKAIKDPEVAPVYQAYVAKRAAYETYIKGLQSSLPALTGTVKACDAASLQSGGATDNSADLAAAMGKVDKWLSGCRTALGDLSKVGNPDIAEFGTDLDARLGSMRKDVDLLKGIDPSTDLLSNPTAMKQFQTALTDLQGLSRDLAAIDAAFSRSMHKSALAADPTASLEKLNALLTKKAA